MIRSAVYLGLVLCSLVFVLSSCEREVSDAAPGEPVRLRFSAHEIGYGADENLTRSAGSRVLESVNVPLGDRWSVSADLVDDGVSPARAVEDGLVNGAKVVIVAYNKFGDYLDHDIYSFNTSSQDLDNGEEGGIVVNTGAIYCFVALSYNSTTVTPHYDASIDAISPAYDLLWGRIDQISITSANQRIDIGVSHRFMKVRLRTDVVGGSNPELSDLSASLLSNYEADLTVSNGDITQGAPVTYAFTATDDGSDLTGPGKNLSSDYGLVYTGGDNPFYVKINSVTLSDGSSKTFTDLVASFTKPLLSGRSYSLQITFKKGIAWAGSNIYWDGNKLTFEPTGYSGPKSNYQGVFFQWGSLVGVSPAALPENGDFQVGTSGNPATGTPIYVYHGGIWQQTNVATAYDTGVGGFMWGAIPRMAPLGANDNYLYENDDFANNQGDICKFIGLHGGPTAYRMPIIAEFVPDPWGDWNSWDSGAPNDTPVAGWTRTGGGSWSTDNTDQAHPGGTKNDFTSGASHTGRLFPAAGGRGVGGELWGIGSSGGYWSGSAGDSSDAYRFSFASSGVGKSSSDDGREAGYPVRCVKI
jgi:hypothetical protein